MNERAPLRPVVDLPDFELRSVEANGLRIQVAVAGRGRPVLLLHGWPFTWFLWRTIMKGLVAQGYRVIAPDLRGIGGTERPEGGYDLHTLSDDAARLLVALDAREAVVVGFDLGTSIAWMLAMRHPELVRKLVVMEGVIGRLPGAEAFFSRGAPWWFGFHGAPGLAEAVLVGHEREYLDWFFTPRAAGHRAIDAAAREVFVDAYTGREALRGGFEHYRALPVNAAQVAEIAAHRRLTVPTMALAGGVVGESLHGQLVAGTNDLTGHLIPECGHVIPEEQPEALLALLLPFLA